MDTVEDSMRVNTERLNGIEDSMQSFNDDMVELRSDFLKNSKMAALEKQV